jgi:hypothetical protein
MVPTRARARKVPTPEVTRRICTLVQHGVPLRYALVSEGLAKTTVRRWRARGETGEQPFADFTRELNAAVGKLVSSMVMCVHDAAMAGDWKAAAWFLERRCPKEFGPPRARVSLERAPTQMTAEELDAAIVRLGFVRIDQLTSHTDDKDQP